VIGDTILVCAPQKNPVYAIKGNGKGDLSKNKWLWSPADKKISSDICTPALYNEKIYLLNGEKRYLNCLNSKDGAVHWQVELPGRARYFTSPTICDNKLYCMNQEGLVVVISTIDGKILHTTEMGINLDHPMRSTIAISDSQFFIRTNTMLYCIGQK
jgi:outer membrane protein assembly factor BamB